MTHHHARRTRRLVAVSAAVAAVALLVAGCTGTTPTDTKTPMTLRTEPNTKVFPGGLYLQADSLAHQAAVRLAADGQESASKAAAAIAETPVSIWLGDQYSAKKVGAVVAANLAAAKKQGKTAVFVTYAIPNRDCGDFSAGGFSTAEYPTWMKAVTRALARGEKRGEHSAVIVEPDSLAMLSNCPSQTDTRIPLIRQSVKELHDAGIPAYLDAGNSHWVQPAEMASRLKKAGIRYARGFFTNVASFYPVDDERAYAEKVSNLTGGAKYVIDVSRNGQGWKGTWCNPEGTGLGQAPHVSAGTTGLDALLWIKSPGVSDGTCNGGPKAGQWYASYAEALVKNRRA
ncbi:glycoside hydrolase family 6 protein [Frondihabitans australicus]|uniref:Glucanase n=1 Tax=Frondihabitans australicus TaxID=386892 RepID=A0A495IJR6_9MICO|nr:glycoside hydrolase family 6 protein [Frondihabitans australicus]RKR76029.1 endoglucanase [Frondihabitans australicus]